jgi:hypothetical protein
MRMDFQPYHPSSIQCSCGVANCHLFPVVRTTPTKSSPICFYLWKHRARLVKSAVQIFLKTRTRDNIQVRNDFGEYDQTHPTQAADWQVCQEIIEFQKTINDFASLLANRIYPVRWVFCLSVELVYRDHVGFNSQSCSGLSCVGTAGAFSHLTCPQPSYLHCVAVVPVLNERRLLNGDEDCCPMPLHG